MSTEPIDSLEEADSATVDSHKYKWFVYLGKKTFSLKGKESNRKATITKGSLYGMRNLNDRVDRIVVFTVPDYVFSLPVETVSDILDDSKRYIGEVKLPEKEKMRYGKVSKPAPTPILVKHEEQKKAVPVKIVKTPVKLKLPKKKSVTILKPKQVDVKPDDKFLLDDEDDFDPTVPGFLFNLGNRND